MSHALMVFIKKHINKPYIKPAKKNRLKLFETAFRILLMLTSISLFLQPAQLS